MVTRTPGPFDYYGELPGHKSATGDTIRADAEDPGLNATTLSNISADLDDDKKTVGTQIDGDISADLETIPHNASGKARQLAQDGWFAIGVMKRFAGNVDTFDTKTNTCNTDYHSKVSALHPAGHPVDEDGNEIPKKKPTTTPGDIESSIRKGDYATALEYLETSAKSVETDLNKPRDERNAMVKKMIIAGLIPLAMADYWPGLTLTDAEKQKYYKNALKNLSPEEQKQWIKDNKDHLDPSAAKYVDPSVQKELGETIAAEMKKEGRLGDDYVKMMTFLSGQVPFAHAMYSNLTPEDISKEIENWDHDVYPGGKVASKNDDAMEEAYRKFLTAAGTTFATYTKGTGEYAPPSDLAKTWYDQITDGDDGDGARLTLLLRAGGHNTSYDTDFIGDLSKNLYDWERGQDKSGLWLGNDEANRTINPFLTTNDDYSYATDGLANILGAMENSPDAAREFFQDESGGVDQGKIDYLVGHLNDDGDPEGRTFSSDRYSDEGAGLGAALEAATTSEKDKYSADLTSTVFNRIADMSGKGDSGLNPLDDSWHAWPGMTEHLGNMAASYSSDVYDIVHKHPNPSDTSLQISSDKFDTLLGEIGRGDKTGVETLASAIVLEGNDRLDDAIQEWKAKHPGEPIDIESVATGSLGPALQGVGGTNGEVLGHIINKAITVDEADKSLAETRAAYISKAVDIGGGFIPGAGTVLGDGASELAKSAYDVGKSEGLDLLKKAVDGSEPATGDDWNRSERSNMSDVISYQTTSQLIKSGVIGVGDGPDDIPASLVTDGPNGTKVLNPDIYDADGPDTIGKDGEYTDAQKAQMKKDLYEWSRHLPSAWTESIVQPAQDGLDRELNK